MVTEDYKKNRLKNIRKRREHLDSNYTKSELIYEANQNRLYLEKANSKHIIVNHILMREFGSYRMGNNKLNPKKVIFPKKIKPKLKLKKKKYEVESTRNYNIVKQFDSKKNAVDFIKNNINKGLGTKYYLNGLNSKGKYQSMEDYYYGSGKSGRKKLTKLVSRKLSDLD